MDFLWSHLHSRGRSSTQWSFGKLNELKFLLLFFSRCCQGDPEVNTSSKEEELIKRGFRKRMWHTFFEKPRESQREWMSSFIFHVVNQ